MKLHESRIAKQSDLADRHIKNPTRWRKINWQNRLQAKNFFINSFEFESFLLGVQNLKLPSKKIKIKLFIKSCKIQREINIEWKFEEKRDTEFQERQLRVTFIYKIANILLIFMSLFQMSLYMVVIPWLVKRRPAHL